MVPRRPRWMIVSLFLGIVLVLAACAQPATPAPATVTAPAAPPPSPTSAPAQPTSTPTAAPKAITFGMLLVGPYNDRGWSQAHYEAGKYVERKLPGAKMLYIDKVNPADRPGTTASQLAEELVAQGAKVIIFNSDDHKDEAIKFARAHPDIVVIHASGDDAWKEGKNYKGIPNLANVMGQMEYGKMIAGCAAALTTQTGKLGYLGPLINDETRRLAASAYLGAKYCWEKYRGKPAADLKFKVTWIGFWFHIPGVTADPTQVAQDFINSGYDVIISGIDTTEALREAAKATQAGKKVWAIPYDYIGACEEAPDVCLGVPYFNWGPAYLAHIKAVLEGTWKPSWDWVGPDWKDINNPDTSYVGFLKGKALSPEASAKLDEFIKGLGDGSIQLWKGPIRLQDGTVYVAEGQVATPQQIWYLPQLLEGMEGQSVPTK